MIEGLQLDVPASELIDWIGGRIAHHQARATAHEAQLGKLAEVPASNDDDLDVPVRRYRDDSPREALERKLRAHRDRATYLGFLRDHIVTQETYRLDEADLQALEIAPCGW